MSSFMRYGFEKNVIEGFLIFLGLIIFMAVVAYFTYIKITPDKKMVHKILESGFTIDITAITQIDRTPAFIFKGRTSRLKIHYRNEKGHNYWDTIREANYDVELIKQVLQRLKNINPSIKLHPQYQALVDGKIKDEDDFKRLPISDTFHT